ncbi:hypothetical protein AXF42_Ash002266 [Apostasia shenzhenica]|uniref:Uncharacterized protein n=1 Tax=Apostasia shenzhenica TaxID=1088818 RepID=A0A2I0AN21_9ASPA|nr:hypothetical protein AXF42_Ash002266 [Apostasia shenzhenica]
MDSTELMASEFDDHSNELRSFPMVHPLKRVAEEEPSSVALPPVKKAAVDLIDDAALTDWETELEQEPVECFDEEFETDSSPDQEPLTFSSILECYSCHGIPYEKLYLAFKEAQRKFLHTHFEISEGLEDIRKNSIYWQDIPEQRSFVLANRLDIACTFLRDNEVFEKCLLESIDCILETSKKKREVADLMENCEDSCFELRCDPRKPMQWFLNWLDETEAPWSPKRAKAHALMLKLALRKYIIREEFEHFGIFRRNCIHCPFYDRYDPNKEFESCLENCMDYRKLFPILQMHSNFMKWLNDGTSETHEFISSLLNVNFSLNLKGSMDIPDNIIHDCKMFYDLPKELIRDCIYDTIIVKRKEVEAGKELEVLRHIVNHECAVKVSMQSDVFVCDEFDSNIPDYVYEYTIKFYRKFFKNFVSHFHFCNLGLGNIFVLCYT